MQRIGRALAALAASAVGAAALAEHPDVLREYRFIPLRSALVEVHPAFEVNLTIRGTFNTVTGFDHDQDPWIGRSLIFDDVRAGAFHPILAIVLNLDRELNLSSLTGVELPVGAPFDVFKFDGKTSNGSAIQLFASVIGPWFLLNGETTPPGGGSNVLPYVLHAVARERPFADFTDDGYVDASDLGTLASRFGMTGSAGDATQYGDADGDGDVDGADFLAWQRQAGESAPGALLAAHLSAAAWAAASVPEPAAWGLVIVLIPGFLTASRRRAPAVTSTGGHGLGL